MNVIIFGPPGAGKGTQSKNITNDFNLVQLSTGDLFRKEINNKTELGKKIETLINSGKLVSDEIVNNLIEDIISNSSISNKFLFDGYPRTLPQVYTLDKILKGLGQKISIVISLNVDQQVIIKRINGRIICTKCFKIFNEYFNPPDSKDHLCKREFLEKRPDDSAKTIINRFQNYISKTKPILEYYKKKGSLCEIDGNKKIDEIYDRIKGILNNIRH
tara:strand:+ start:616 stop:1266 length:651 start_codon:yes stop_codon:yes gene_type:complete